MNLSRILRNIFTLLTKVVFHADFLRLSSLRFMDNQLLHLYVRLNSWSADDVTEEAVHKPWASEVGCVIIACFPNYIRADSKEHFTNKILILPT